MLGEAASSFVILTATASGWITVERVSQLGHLPPGPQTASEVAWVPFHFIPCSP